MMRFLLLSAVSVCLLGGMVHAQTPQQMEMLKNKGVLEEEKKPVGVYKDEKTGKFVIPKNDGESKLILPDGREMMLPLPKTDEELMQSRRGPNSKLMKDMTAQEAQEYMNYVVQDRIFLSVKDIQVIGGGLTKVCPMTVQVLNNTPRIIKKLSVKYQWGETYIPIEFSNVAPVETVPQRVSLAGPVCDLVFKGAQYEVTSCLIDGLTEEQCKMRIAKL